MHDLIADLMQWRAWVQPDRSGLRENAQLHVGLAHIRKLLTQNVPLIQVHEDCVTCQLVELPEQLLCLPITALLQATILQGQECCVD